MHTIIIPSYLTEIIPRYPLGQLVPLDELRQPTPGITYYGIIVGLELLRYEPGDHEWIYSVELLAGHPDLENGLTTWAYYPENKIEFLLKNH
jgi:hypothetical protein